MPSVLYILMTKTGNWSNDFEIVNTMILSTLLIAGCNAVYESSRCKCGKIFMHVR